MKLGAFVRRYRWSVLIVLAAAALWWPAFNYLVDFRHPDVPFVTTPADVVAAMLGLAEVAPADTYNWRALAAFLAFAALWWSVVLASRCDRERPRPTELAPAEQPEGP